MDTFKTVFNFAFLINMCSFKAISSTQTGYELTRLKKFGVWLFQRYKR